MYTLINGFGYETAHTSTPYLASPTSPSTPPGGGAAYLMGGLRAKFYDTTFKRTSAANGNGGAVVVASDFDKMNVTERSAADFTRCTFEDFQADFYGQAVFSSVAQLRLFDSHLAADEGMSLAAGTVFDFGVTSDCQSGCGRGQYGTCEKVRANSDPNLNLNLNLAYSNYIPNLNPNRNLRLTLTLPLNPRSTNASRATLERATCAPLARTGPSPAP